jgi:hypothetical protein
MAKQKKSFLRMLKESFSGLDKCEQLDLKRAYQLSDNNVRVSPVEYPIQVNYGPEGMPLHIYPERPLGESKPNDHSDRFIIFDPKNYYKKITGFLRLNPGDKVTLGYDKQRQEQQIAISREVKDRQLSIKNDSGTLIFTNHAAKAGACLAPLIKTKEISRISKWRNAKLKRLHSIFGGPIVQLNPDDALSLIHKTNNLMQSEDYRPKDKKGRPGGIIELPAQMRPVLIGDLHGKVDNLLVVLSQNGFLEELKNGRACLVILGDAVHPDEGDLEDMESSILIMDLIFKLKLRFPKQVFYLRGNHDSFSEEIGKQGVPQGLLWEKALLKSRGKRYRDEMKEFYNLLPYLAYSKYFITCHAAPPTSSVSKEDLINIRQTPSLIPELINNRMRTSSKPSGYFKRDVKRLRKCLDLPADTTVIVGHTVLSCNETLWETAGDIENHIVIYGGDSRWIGVITRIDGEMKALRYPVEKLLPLVNEID